MRCQVALRLLMVSTHFVPLCTHISRTGLPFCILCWLWVSTFKERRHCGNIRTFFRSIGWWRLACIKKYLRSGNGTFVSILFTLLKQDVVGAFKISVLQQHIKDASANGCRHSREMRTQENKPQSNSVTLFKQAAATDIPITFLSWQIIEGRATQLKKEREY